MYDAIIVGAGAAGLSAGLMLGRARRKVLVLDGGPPRNAPADAAHGFLTRDGTPPLELLRLAREELRPYASVEVRPGLAVEAARDGDSFAVHIEGGGVEHARKLILATGLADMLPEIPGLRELWGAGAFHCPYCHGWEVRDRPLGILDDGPAVLDRVTLLRGWSSDLSVLSNGPSSLDSEARARLHALGVGLYEAPIARLDGDADRQLRQVVFEDGTSLPLGGVLVAAKQVQRSPLAAALGCELMMTAHGAEVVKTDPQTRETTVPGVYAVGDGGGVMQAVIQAAASGALAAAMLNHALAAEDVEVALGARAAA